MWCRWVVQDNKLKVGHDQINKVVDSLNPCNVLILFSLVT